ncbi:hypothetical protein FIBSPDRAFT_945694 [Athelia psychrophila]|uniref:Uncharacterized protein n=1 Tax=Athelia psychrophila TaxID=1759441 RepID=A0A166TM59_9AGAM|nr:hypothetical protein FIBSPDRAFT_945694 [Fibularhizoctonia sp. CBS 109695]
MFAINVWNPLCNATKLTDWDIEGLQNNFELLKKMRQAFTDSYAATETTEGLHIHCVKRPVLRRTVSPTTCGERPKIVARGVLGIKVCVKAYPFFYGFNFEEVHTAARMLEVKHKTRKKRLQGFHGSLPFIKT